MMGEDGDDLVAVDKIALLVDTKTAVAVAVKSDAEVEMVVGDELLEEFGMSATTMVVDFGVVVGVAMDELGLSTEGFENGFADDGSGTVGTVDTDLETVKVDIAEVFEEMVGVELDGFGV